MMSDAILAREQKLRAQIDDLRRRRDELRAALAKAAGLLAAVYDTVMNGEAVAPGEVGDLHDEIDALLARCT